jgi:hypothetical protein
MGKDLRLNELTVTLPTNFQIDLEAKDNSKNGISCYMRAVRAVHYSAIKKDQFIAKKIPPNILEFQPRDEPKRDFIKISDVDYTKGTPIWHVKNYALIMYNCRGNEFSRTGKTSGQGHKQRLHILRQEQNGGPALRSNNR